jgi:hypothetical protein
MSDGRIGVDPPVRASTDDDQVLREPLADILEVVQDHSVSVRQPPVGDDPLGQQNHVARQLFTVDDEVTRRATASSHLLLESVRRSVRGPVQSLLIEPPPSAGVAAYSWSPHYGLVVYGPAGSCTSVTTGKWWKLLVIAGQIPPGARSTTRSIA